MILAFCNTLYAAEANQDCILKKGAVVYEIMEDDSLESLTIPHSVWIWVGGEITKEVADRLNEFETSQTERWTKGNLGLGRIRDSKAPLQGSRLISFVFKDSQVYGCKSYDEMEGVE